MPDAPVFETQQPAAATAGGDSLFEVIDGRVVEKPPTGAYEAMTATVLVGWLYKSGVAEALGRPASEVLFRLDLGRDLKRRPDVAFVSFERWPRRRPVPQGEAWDVVPDLTVEVVSPSNTAAEVVTKVDEYFRAGVRLAWVIYPVQRLIYVHASPADVRVLRAGEVLDGGPVLPGFRVAVTDLFEDAGGGADDAPVA